MDKGTGRPNHIEDFLCVLHKGGWYEWIDYKNKIYSNLKLTEKMWNSSYTGDVYADGLIDNPYSLPTEQECIDGLAKLQTDFDAQDYSRKREKEYPSIADQLDDIYHNGIDGWKSTIKVTKDKYTKG